jgi:ribosomal protein S12 methylthiotransferase
VIVNSKRKLNPGEFVQVCITGAFDYDLEGEIID